MICSFNDVRLEKSFRSGKPQSGLPANLFNSLIKKLSMLDQAETEEELASNSMRYKKLIIVSNTVSSVRVNSKYRLFFTWDNGAHNVQLSAHDYKSLVH